MANSGPGTASPLAHVAQRAKAVQRTRDNLGLSGAGRPNGGMSPSTPPPSAPAAAAPAANPAAPAAAGDPNSREAMLARTQDMLAQASNGGQAVAPTEPIQSPAPPPPVGMDQQLTRLGATNLPLSTQFQRLAGRPATGRELVVSSAFQQLSRELGRAPTRTELAYRVTQNPGAATIEPVI